MVNLNKIDVYDDDLNRIVDSLNLEEVTNQKELEKRINGYANVSGQGGFRFPFQFFQAIKEKWEKEIKPVSTGLGKPEKFDTEGFFRVQTLFDAFKDERKKKIPKKDRNFRRRVVKGEPKFEVKVGGRFINFNKVTFVRGYIYERKGRIIRVKDHIRGPRKKPKRRKKR